MRSGVVEGVLLAVVTLSGCSRDSHVTPLAILPAASRGAPTGLRAQPGTDSPVNGPVRPPGNDQASAGPRTAQNTSEEQFNVAGQKFNFVKHAQKIEGSTSPDDVTVDWWELRDSSGKAVYHQEYPVSFQGTTFGETNDAIARLLKTHDGAGILVEGGWLPSTPNGGWWVQVFGFFNGKLKPFSTPISMDGEFLGEDVETFQPTPLFQERQVQPVSHDVLKFREWTGNFSILYSAAIDWIQGTVHPAWTCHQLTSKGPGSSCRYQVQADPVRAKEMTFVRLFSEPDEGFMPKHVVIKPDAKIEYIEAQMPVSWSSEQSSTTIGVKNDDDGGQADKIWLHIRVDGQDGWIFSQEDFEAVGLPQAG